MRSLAMVDGVLMADTKAAQAEGVVAAMPKISVTTPLRFSRRWPLENPRRLSMAGALVHR